MARCCSLAVDISQKLVSGEKEQAYHDDLKKKNLAFQEALIPYIQEHKNEGLSEYLNIIGSPQFARVPVAAEELDFSFMEAQSGEPTSSAAEC